MVTEVALSKKEILLRIIGSGINISPNALEMLSQSHVTNRDIENIVRQISYLSSFNSQITLETLKKTNYYSQIDQDANKKEDPNVPIKTLNNNNANANANFQENNAHVLKQVSSNSNNSSLNNSSLNNSSLNNSSSNNSNSNIIFQKKEHKRVDHQKDDKQKKSIVKSEMDSLRELTELTASPESSKISKHNSQLSRKTSDNLIAKQDQKLNKRNPRLNSEEKDYAKSKNETKFASEKIKSKYRTDDQSIKLKKELEQELNQDINQNSGIDLNQDHNLEVIQNQKSNLSQNQSQNQTHEEGSRLKEMENFASRLEFSGGTSTFQPIAKDYNDQVTVKTDPTSNLYSSGSIEDFISLVRDKYNKLKSILLKNPEVQDAKSIKNILSMQTSDNIGLIGMIKDKTTQSGEKKNIRLKLEDLTGEIDVLVINDDRNREAYDKMIYLLNDQVVYISGYLKIDQKRKSRIIFANKVVWPDIPIGHRPSIPDSPVSIALISDVHIGSKNFLPKLFDRFIKYLRCEIGNERQRQEAGRIKYLVIGGDLVDGIGIYPDQDKELDITDIYEQYSEAARLLSNVPDYIKIIYSPGNHEPIRNAIPHPSVPKKYCEDLINQNVALVGNPCFLNLHGIDLLTFHGDSLIDVNVSIPGLSNDKPELAMKEYLRCRHLAPMYGGKTELAPMEKDWLVIDEIPHVFHTGHVHINGMDHYRGVLNINTGCFQSQTSFMKSLGIVPTPGYPVIVSPQNGKLNAFTINLND